MGKPKHKIETVPEKGENEERPWMGIDFFLRSDKNVLELDNSDGCTTKKTKNHLTAHFQKVNFMIKEL